MILQVKGDASLPAQLGGRVRLHPAEAAIDVRYAQPLAELRGLRAESARVSYGAETVIIQDLTPGLCLGRVETLRGRVRFPNLHRAITRGRDITANGIPGLRIGRRNRLLVLVAP